MNTYHHSLGQHTITCDVDAWERFSGETMRSSEDVRAVLDLQPGFPATLSLHQDEERVSCVEGPEALRTFTHLAWEMEHAARFTKSLNARPEFLSPLLKGALTTEARQHIISQRWSWDAIDPKSQIATLTGMRREDVVRAFDGHLVEGLETLDALADALNTTALDILTA